MCVKYYILSTFPISVGKKNAGKELELPPATGQSQWSSCKTSTLELRRSFCSNPTRVICLWIFCFRGIGKVPSIQCLKNRHWCHGKTKLSINLTLTGNKMCLTFSYVSVEEVTPLRFDWLHLHVLHCQ